MEAFPAVMQANLVEILVLLMHNLEVDLVEEAVEERVKAEPLKAALLIKVEQVVVPVVQYHQETQYQPHQPEVVLLAGEAVEVQREQLGPQVPRAYQDTVVVAVALMLQEMPEQGEMAALLLEVAVAVHHLMVLIVEQAEMAAMVFAVFTLGKGKKHEIRTNQRKCCGKHCCRIIRICT
jgi:hypothetical protein